AGGLTFQAVLGIDGSIRFNYQSLSTGHNGGAHDLGISATSGLKDWYYQGPNRLLLMYDNGPTGLVNSGTSVGMAPVPPADYYSFTVAAAEIDTLAITGVYGSDPLNIDLLDSNGLLIATGISGPTNLTKVISDISLVTPGTYYARITGTNYSDYTLLLT